MNKLKSIIRTTYLGDLLRHLKAKFELNLRHQDSNLGFKFLGNSNMKNGTYDLDLLEFLRQKFPSHNENYIDVGAHQGYFVCFANANKVKNVFAVEPDIINFNFLKKNIAKNKFYEKTQCFNIGLANYAGFLDLYGFSTGISAFENWGGNSSKRKTRVKTSTFDEQFKNQLPLRNSIIKIDVEGFELEVIKGARNAIASATHTLFVVEISLPTDNSKANSHIAEILKFFQQHGYSLSMFVNDNGKPLAMDYSDPDELVRVLKTFQSINFLFEKHD
jgi:FkbM family methyltransferase